MPQKQRVSSTAIKLAYLQRAPFHRSVIASVAKQSRGLLQCLSGLLRYARNDGLGRGRADLMAGGKQLPHLLYFR